MQSRPQNTLRSPIDYCGVGLHTGQEVTLRFVPAPPHTGLVFRRVDLSGNPTIPATVEYVQETARSTTIGVGNCMVHTVEHVLAALHAYQIDNLIIEVTASEPPVGDGSSSIFVEMIEEVGIEPQEAQTKIVTIKEPVYVSEGATTLVALPSDAFRISYTLHYPQTSVIRSQYYSTQIDAEHFKQELSPCRTFALYDEISLLMERGLIRGGSLENAVVIKNDVIFSKEGLRFPDEMVRHKMLDLVGDLALVGFHFHAHVVAVRSGHTSNVALGKALMSKIASY